MASKDDVRTRAPRGTKVVTQAFFEALDGIAEGQQKAVAAAALAGIRDALKAQRLKTKEAAAKAKAKLPAKAAPKRATKAATATRRAAGGGRKQVAAKKAPVAKAVPGKMARRKSPRKVVSSPSETTME